MAKIPKTLYSQLYETADQILRSHFRHAQNCNRRIFPPAEFLQLVRMLNRNIRQHFSCKILILVKNTNDRESFFQKIHMGQDSTAQVASAD